MLPYTLRPWTPNDLSSLLRYADNPLIAQNMTDQFPHPYTKEAGLAFIERANQHKPPLMLAIEFEQEAIGGIGLHPQSDIYRLNAELGYWIGEPFWGKGIASFAIGEMVAYGFKHLDIQRIFARPFGRNIASQKALEKNGFTLEAKIEQNLIKNGHPEDELIYAFRRR